MAESDFAILILSCDKYADLWAPFFSQFKRRFTGVDYPIYLGSNLLRCDEPGVITILSGSDDDWSSSYVKILNQIKEQRLFVILEDLLPATNVDGVHFKSIVRFMNDYDAKHIKYWPNPKPDMVFTADPRFGIYSKGAPYRSTVCGFWDREYLLKLLLPGESPWNFEIFGSYRTSYSDGFYSLKEPLFECRNMIEKGSWIADSVEWALGEKIDLQLDRRPQLKGKKHGLSLLKMRYFDLLIRLPWKRRVTIMNVLRKALISY